MPDRWRCGTGRNRPDPRVRSQDWACRQHDADRRNIRAWPDIHRTSSGSDRSRADCPWHLPVKLPMTAVHCVEKGIGGGRHLLRHVMFQAALVAPHHNPVLNPSPIDCALPANHTKSPSQPLHANASQSRMRFVNHDRTGAIPQVEDTVASKGAAPNRDRSRPLQSARYTILVCWRDALQSRRCKRSKHYIALTVLVMHIATLQL